MAECHQRRVRIDKGQSQKAKSEVVSCARVGGVAGACYKDVGDIATGGLLYATPGQGVQ